MRTKPSKSAARGRARAVGFIAAAAVAALTTAPGIAQAAWNQPAGPVGQDAGGLSSAATIGGAPYVAWTLWDGNNHEVRVSRLNATGTAWEEVVGGASPINHNSGDALELRLIGIGGVPYVAWTEHDGTNRELRVARLNAAGTAWEQVVGGASPINQDPGRDAFQPSLTSAAGVPYVGWRENDGTNDIVRVARLNAAGTAWEQMGPINRDPARRSEWPNLTAIGGVAYVTWTEDDASSKYQVRVARLNAAGTAWAEVAGGASPINQATNRWATQPDLIGIGGVPYVTWVEDDLTNNELRVARLNGAGTAWEQVVGGASPINQDPGKSASVPRLTAIGGVPYVGWYEHDGTNREVRVARLNPAGTAWEQPVGGASPINQAPNANAFGQLSLTAVGGVPYVGWKEGNGQFRVSRLEPEFLGTSVASNDTSATFVTDVRTYGLEYPVGFEYGPGFASSTRTVESSGNIDTITRTVNGLSPSTTYQFRPFATAGIPAPRVTGGADSFTTSPQNGPGATGPQGATGTQGATGPQGADGPQLARSDARVACKVNKPRRRVKCTVTYPEAGAQTVSLELMQRGKIISRGEASRPKRSMVLRLRSAKKGSYSLRIITIGRDGSEHTRRQTLRIR
jgi:hypothetical protein